MRVPSSHSGRIASCDVASSVRMRNTSIQKRTRFARLGCIALVWAILMLDVMPLPSRC